MESSHVKLTTATIEQLRDVYKQLFIPTMIRLLVIAGMMTES